MNNDGATPPDSTKDSHSDQDFSSPAASGTSDQRNGLSSADTTPPPQDGSHDVYGVRTQSYDITGDDPRSYQSILRPIVVESAPSGHGFSQYHRESSVRRPLSTDVTTAAQEDEAGLAAAVELLSCSFGTPNATTLAGDIPPVPPLPTQYLGQSFGTSFFSGATLTSYPRAGSTSYLRENSYKRREVRNEREKDVKMEDVEGSAAEDEDFDSQSRARSDEDDDGVFGRMEE